MVLNSKNFKKLKKYWLKVVTKRKKQQQQNITNFCHLKFTMAYFIKSLTYLLLNVCCCAATMQPAKVNKLSKIVSLLEKKFLRQNF